MNHFLRTLEWPTALLALTVYGLFLGLTALLGADGVIALPLLAVLLALHGSLQHECIHGHPTRSDRINAWIAGWPLSLWIPYGLYRRSHRAHHGSAALTDPKDDPESFYLAPKTYGALGPIRRSLAWALQTLIGRLVLGPAVVMLQLFADEARRVARGDRRHVVDIAWHLAGVTVVLGWLSYVEVSWAVYFFGAVYPGLSLTLLRSFAEHEPHPDPELRTVVTESRALGWLYLHNNLHVVHHASPGLPWYEVPAAYRRTRPQIVARGHRVRRGYRTLWRFLLHPKGPPVTAVWSSSKSQRETS